VRIRSGAPPVKVTAAAASPDVEKKAPPKPFERKQVDPNLLSPQLKATPSKSMSLGSQLPQWVPEGFQLSRAAKSMTELLAKRGEPIAPAKTLVVTDADHTVLQTKAATLLRDQTTGELARHPLTGDVIRIGAEIDAERAALQQQFPQLPWASLVNDFHEFDDALDIAQSPTIAPMISTLRASQRDPDARQYLITARQSNEALAALENMSGRERLGLDAVFSANAKTEVQALGVEGVKLGTAEHKALMIAALVEAHRTSAGSAPERVTFYDDGDDNLARARELLPALFPGVKFEFVDVVHVGDGSYQLK
jgi:hypothetical protein